MSETEPGSGWALALVVEMPSKQSEQMNVLVQKASRRLHNGQSSVSGTYLRCWTKPIKSRT